MTSDEEMLHEFEVSLWRMSSRFDRAHMERVLAPDFFEFGRSGRVYDRAACLDMPAGEIVAELRQIQVRLLQPNVALVTYISVVTYETVEHANRSSIWTRTGSGWQLRFHQGTPIES